MFLKMNPNNFSTADYYTFPQIIQKEKSLDVPKCLHFLYIGKAIRDNYVDNIRQNLNQYFITFYLLFRSSAERSMDEMSLHDQILKTKVKLKINKQIILLGV